ncbi:MAG: prepilin-type N-terminal cleavage/methylation domain-containing protein [Phycisphaerales bacterium]|nr:MAG: prepilin-type N-terminal cleavage/methylation domain-containing protein [Phycisphaerales bacterium]
MTRRAFTLLELMLAMAIGVVVLGAAFGVFFTVSTTDRRLERRYDEMAEIERTRIVMERTFSTLVVAEGSDPVAREKARREREAADAAAALDKAASTGSVIPSSLTPVGSPAGTKSPTSSAANAAAAAKALADAGLDTGAAAEEDAPLPVRAAPRLRLTLDDPARFSDPLGYTAVSSSNFTPQRLEVVLSASPVPVSTDETLAARLAYTARERREREKDYERRKAEREQAAKDAAISGQTLAPGDESPLEQPTDEPVVQAVRGAFELRPVPPAQLNAMSVPEDSKPLWELWWVPLPPRFADDDAENAELTAIQPPDLLQPVGQPYRLASKIEALEWRVFVKSQRQTTYTLAYTNDIPAYVEMELKTRSGFTANWLFELNWVSGAEVNQPVAVDASGKPISPSATTGSAATRTTGSSKPGASGSKPAATPLNPGAVRERPGGKRTSEGDAKP